MRLFLLLLALFAAPVQAQWRVAETAHFRLHEDTSEDKIREHAALLEDYRSLLITMTNVGAEDRAPAPKLNVYLVKNIADARPLSKLAPNVAGFYTANPGGVAAFAADGILGMSTVLHEYAHHFMLAAGAIAYPAWYVEGFAEYFMTAEFKPDRVEYGNFNEIRAVWLLRGTWLPLSRVLASKFKRTNSQDTAMFYAQSWVLTHYLLRTEGGPEKLRAYLAATAQGADPVEAFKAHIASKPESFNNRLKAYLQSRKFTRSAFKRPEVTPASVQITTLPAAAKDLLMPLVDLELAPPSAPIKDSATQVITKAAAKHSEDPMAERALALLALRFGSNADAAARLDTLLEAAPNDSTLLLWRAQTTKTSAEALPLLVRSYKANPDDWRALRAYALARGARTKKLSENDLNVLTLAWQLAPQVDILAIDLSVALAHADQLPKAAVVLAPLAASPHESPVKARAERLLEAARANDNPGFFAVLATPQIEMSAP